MDFANSTIMSVLAGIAQPDQVVRRDKLEIFATQYTQPLVHFLCRTRRLTPEYAEEIVQDFWLAKLIQPPPDQNFVARYLIAVAQADAQAGSFRRYLMRSIANHYLDTVRRNKHAPKSLDAMTGLDAASPPEDWAFDAAWANSILRRCVTSVRDECQSNGQVAMWNLFCDHIVRPKLLGEPAPGYAILAQRFDFKDAKSAANAVRTIIRKFQTHLQSQVMDYLPVLSPEERPGCIEQECAELIGLLSKPGVLNSVMFEDITEGSPRMRRNLSTTTAFSVASELPSFLEDPLQTLYSCDADYSCRWKQVLATSIAAWLEANGQSTEALLPAPAVTFGQMVAGFALEPAVLSTIRNTAKQRAREVQDEPKRVLATLYLTSIASAYAHYEEILTADPTEKILRRLDQILSYHWLDADSRGLLTGFQKALETKASGESVG